MATKIVANSGTSTWKMRIRVTYTENGSGITLTKVEGSRTETSGTESYDNDCNVLVNGAVLTKGAYFPINSKWKTWWTGTKKLSTYTATFTFSNCNTASIKNCKFVLKVTATKYTITYVKGTGVSEFTGATSVNLNASVTTKASAETGYYLDHYTRTRAGNTATSSAPEGLKTHNHTFASIVGDTTLGCYSSPYKCKVTFHKNDGGNATYSETYTAGVANQKFGMNTTGTSGQFGSWDRTGYTLLGWSASKTATSATYPVFADLSNSFIEKNHDGINLYAVWKAKTYYLYYDANGGDGAPPTQKRTVESSVKIPSTKPTRNHYTFLGWSTSKTATSATYVEGDLFTSTKADNVVLYAVWIEKLHIIFHRNQTESDTELHGEYYTKGKNNYFGKGTSSTSGQFGSWDYLGHKLLGWSQNPDATEADYSINYVVSDAQLVEWWPETEMYAVWQQDYIYIKSDGVWKHGEVYIKVDGAWKKGLPYIKKNSTWVQ